MITAYIDGAARGNPGPAGYGVRVEGPDGAVLAELRGALGIATNNVAEYQGLLAALTYAVEHAHPVMHIRSDSQLLVLQMQGRYRVRNPGLLALVQRAQRLLSQLGRVSFEHISRTLNKEADRLANLAVDEAAPPEGREGRRA